MDTPESWLLAFGGLVFALLGIVHALFTAQDAVRPSRIVPWDAAVTAAMQGATLKLTRQTTVWKAWIGFNFSHALGLVLFGAGCIGGAVATASVSTAAVALAASAVAVLYLILAVRYFFSTPRNGVILALACFVAATALGLG
ncbi:MAG: hypothetical protein VYB54_06410 [Pseudomonadota bacterium]|nr:hypothetical protein [Pseudomonadota bacterium]